MRFKRPIYRYLFYTGWLLLFGGLATLVIAANGKNGKHTCKGVEVSVNEDGERIVVEKGDVLKTVVKTAKGPLEKKRVADINLGLLEQALERNPWIRDAELYFDTRDVLHVAVWERQPVARVFTTAGASFYMDSSGYQLPLLPGFSARLPVVTGFPANKVLLRKDSLMLQGLKELLMLTGKDSFWKAQVGQIDVTPERKFEIVPLVGSHVIRLGYAENLQQKLNNLLLFYKQVMPRAGLAKYAALDLQFEGQVVAVRKGSASPVDSVQLQKNIDELLKKKAAEQEPEDMAVGSAVAELQTAKIEDSTLINDQVPALGDDRPAAPADRFIPSNSSSEKPLQSSKPVLKPAEKPKAQRSVPVATTNRSTAVQKPAKQTTKNQTQKPKAVMPARE